MRKDRQPPAVVAKFLYLLLPEPERRALMGDYAELFWELADRRGRFIACFWYWVQILLKLCSSIRDSIQWSVVILRNQMVIACRNIKKNKVYSTINLFGLSIGLTAFLLIMLFVRYEFSYDRYHAQARNIYRILHENSGMKYRESNVFFATPGPMAQALVREFPEVRAATRLVKSGDVILNRGDESHRETQLYWADPQTFSIFSFPLVRGDKDHILKDPFAILLSQRAAQRYFGDTDPIGGIITYRIRERIFRFHVEGIFRDIPQNSHFIMDVVAPLETLAKIHGADLTDWGDTNYKTYILLENGADPRIIDQKLPAFMDKVRAHGVGTDRAEGSRFFLQSLIRIHLHSQVQMDFTSPGDFRLVFLLASIASLILIIACINYMNLAMAQSMKRTNEVGLRKVVGAARSQLIWQFLGDSFVLTFLSIALAVVWVLVSLPTFNNFIEKDIVFNPFCDPVLLLGLMLLTAVVSATAGGYPAFVVSGFSPSAAFKDAGVSMSKGRGLRYILIVFQFTTAISLIICTLVVGNQLRFICGRDLGYERERIVVLTTNRGMRSNLDAFKNELLRNHAVTIIASSSELPDNVFSFGMMDESPRYTLQTDHNFVDLYGLKIIQGRGFSTSISSDAAGDLLINESASVALGWDNPVGRTFNLWGEDRPIVGLIKDFHLHPLHLPIMPLFIVHNPDVLNRISIKIRGENIPQTLEFIRATWERFAPGFPFEYAFFDDIVDRSYHSERRMEILFSAFAWLAVIIACLGLFGLASFTAQQRTKEIGIRKVVGASAPSIFLNLSRGFIKSIVLANVMAWPIAYFVMNRWLQNFAYRIHLDIWIFIFAGLAALFIALLTVSYQTIKAARANPIDSLRYE
jgi:putative ABC transport system permease protein